MLLLQEMSKGRQNRRDSSCSPKSCKIATFQPNFDQFRTQNVAMKSIEIGTDRLLMTFQTKSPRRNIEATLRSAGHSSSDFLRYPEGTSVSACFASHEQKCPTELGVRIRATLWFRQSGFGMLMLECQKKLHCCKKQCGML